jgi:hypothetical protein
MAKITPATRATVAAPAIKRRRRNRPARRSVEALIR